MKHHVREMSCERYVLTSAGVHEAWYKCVRAHRVQLPGYDQNVEFVEGELVKIEESHKAKLRFLRLTTWPTKVFGSIPTRTSSPCLRKHSYDPFIIGMTAHGVTPYGF